MDIEEIINNLYGIESNSCDSMYIERSVDFIRDQQSKIEELEKENKELQEYKFKYKGLCK